MIEAITRVKAAARGGEDTDETIDRVLRDAIIDISQRCTVGKMPALGVTVTGGIFLVQDLIEKAKGALLVEIGAICWGRDWLANKVLRHLGKTAAK